MTRYELKCRRHHQANCRLGCRRPSRGSRLNASSEYVYYNGTTATNYLFGETVRAFEDVVEAMIFAETISDAYEAGYSAGSDSSSSDPFSGSGDFGGSSSSDSGSSSSSSDSGSYGGSSSSDSSSYGGGDSSW